MSAKLNQPTEAELVERARSLTDAADTALETHDYHTATERLIQAKGLVRRLKEEHSR